MEEDQISINKGFRIIPKFETVIPDRNMTWEDVFKVYDRNFERIRKIFSQVGSMCTVERFTDIERSVTTEKSFIPMSNQLMVYVNDRIQWNGVDFKETGTNSIQFTYDLNPEDEVTIIIVEIFESFPNTEEIVNLWMTASFSIDKVSEMFENNQERLERLENELGYLREDLKGKEDLEWDLLTEDSFRVRITTVDGQVYLQGYGTILTEDETNEVILCRLPYNKRPLADYSCVGFADDEMLIFDIEASGVVTLRYARDLGTGEVIVGQLDNCSLYTSFPIKHPDFSREIIDARIGINEIYPTLGEAIRGQVSEIRNGVVSKRGTLLSENVGRSVVLPWDEDVVNGWECENHFVCLKSDEGGLKVTCNFFKQEDVFGVAVSNPALAENIHEGDLSKAGILKENKAFVALDGLVKVYDKGLLEEGDHCKAGSHGQAIKSDYGFKVIRRITESTVEIDLSRSTFDIDKIRLMIIEEFSKSEDIEIDTSVLATKAEIESLLLEMEKSSLVQVSREEPNEALVWINPVEENIVNVPEINDDSISYDDTFSSKKISRMVDSLLTIVQLLGEEITMSGSDSIRFQECVRNLQMEIIGQVGNE